MLNTQKQFLDWLEKLSECAKEANIPPAIFKDLEDKVKKQEILVPIVGEFSAGKSTLLNSLLGKDYLPTGIAPETAIATELRYSPQEKIEAILEDDTIEEFAVDDIKKITENAKKYKFIRFYLNNHQLAEVSPIILVDMPGFDSPLDLHNRAIMTYLSQGAHFVVLVSVESATLTGSMIAQLQNILEYERGLSFFVSKANLKSEADVKDICQHVTGLINDNLGLECVAVPIGLDGGTSLKKIVLQLNPEKIFSSIMLPSMKDVVYNLETDINTRISAKKKSSKDNEKAILELKKNIDGIIRKRDSLIQNLKSEYNISEKANNIVNRVGNELSNSISELTAIAINGGSEALTAQMLEITRSTLIASVKENVQNITEKITNSFSYELRDSSTILDGYTQQPDFVGKLTDATTNFLESSKNNLNIFINKRKEKSDSKVLYRTITSILAITTSVVNPAVELVILFLPEIISSFQGLFLHKKQEESIRKQILTVAIPNLKRQLLGPITKQLEEESQAAISNIAENFQKELATKNAEIEKVEAERKADIVTTEAEISRLTQIVNIVREIHQDMYSSK